MQYSWIFLGLSVILSVGSIVLIFTRGLNFGTDFRGGITLVYQVPTTTTEHQLTEIFLEKKVPPFVVQRIGQADSGHFVVKSDIPHDRTSEYSKPFTEALVGKLGQGQITLEKEEFVGPKVGKELRTKGIYAMLWAWVIMLIYVGFRFDFYFAPGAIVALFHDTLITVGAFALTQREVNLTVVAAMMTIVGYSMNDTIIIFDRIRENLVKHKGLPLVRIINISLSQVLIRTLITSLTVFFVVVVLFFRAEGDIKDFAFAMIVGVLVGTYSSDFIASPVFWFLRTYGHRFGIKPKHSRVVTTG